MQDENLRRLVVEIEYLPVAEESSPREIQDLLDVISKSGLADEITLKTNAARSQTNWKQTASLN